MIKLSKRLEVISSLVPVNASVLDIGCDHALLSIYLYQKGNKVIASDINENALNNAKENIKKYNANIDTRLGDGLDVIKDDDNIDTLVISGMGAHTILGMFDKNKEKLCDIKNIIIQSNTKLEFLRREMNKYGYMITDEEIVYDSSKYYTIIKYEKGISKYSRKELYFGPILLKKNSDIFKKYKELELKKLYDVLDKLPKYKIFDRYNVKKKIKLFK